MSLDHAASALERLDLLEYGEALSNSEVIQSAQVHATLAVAEELRRLRQVLQEEAR